MVHAWSCNTVSIEMSEMHNPVRQWLCQQFLTCKMIVKDLTFADLYVWWTTSLNLGRVKPETRRHSWKTARRCQDISSKLQSYKQTMQHSPGADQTSRRTYPTSDVLCCARHCRIFTSLYQRSVVEKFAKRPNVMSRWCCGTHRLWLDMLGVCCVRRGKR